MTQLARSQRATAASFFNNPAAALSLGPQVVFGICGGIIAGVALGCTQVFDSKVKRLVGTYGSSESAAL